MADHTLAMVPALVGTLSSPLLKEIGLLWGLEDELHSLKSTFSTVQAVLEDADSQQHRSEPLLNWLMKLKYVAYDAENTLEEMEIESHRRRRKFALFLQLFTSLRFRIRMAHKVKNLQTRLDAIAVERLNFHLREAGGIARYGVVMESRETCSIVIESEICGRRQEKEIIVGKLLDRELEKDDLSVYAIWGMGGLGKTTLAQLVINDERIKEHFDLRIWVCVSDNFDVKKLLKAMIESIDGNEGKGIEQLDTLQSHLRDKLIGKKFIVVLDDAWEVKDEMWDSLRKILKCISQGNAVIVTTRIKPTATMMATIGVHHLGILSEADSWSLFKQRAFSNNGEVNQSLVQIGKAIVKKCRGIPLAIKALGSLMQSKCGEGEWLAVEKSEIWTLLVNGDEDRISHALRLSYYNLPAYMRQCFAYCCIFPKDYKMKVDEIIQLWMANGFIGTSNNGQKDLPLEGKKIFQELTWRCFFEDSGTDCKGNRVCKMHDLMHDLAMSIMRQETSCTFWQSNDLAIKALGSLFIWKFVDAYDNKIEVSIGKRLCSFIAPALKEIQDEDFHSFLSKQQYLRALDMRHCSIKNLDLGCKFKHLKFLVMSCGNRERLPKSLTHLRKLQTLKLTDSFRLRELPKELKVMKNLCFLEMDDSRSLRSSPPELGNLASLCRLSAFVVGEDALQQIDQLKELNLGGELSIKGLENVKSLEDAQSANLMKKRDLTCLKLYWRDTRGTEDHRIESPEHCDEVLQGLQPPDNIERLSIHLYPGSKFPEWMSSSAYINLKEVLVEDCRKCEHLPPLGKLPSLTRLGILGLDSVKRIGAEWYGDGERPFPQLTTLFIYYMSNLEEWSTPDSVESFPCLTLLDIYECPKLGSLPSLPSLRCLHV